MSVPVMVARPIRQDQRGCSHGAGLSSAIDADPASVRRMVARLEKRHRTLHFCYEAGPTGYGLYWQIVGMGHRCTVVAPSLIPKSPADG
jgi:hypothetical protein